MDFLSKWMTTPAFLFSYLMLITFWVIFNIFCPIQEKFDVQYSLLNVVMGVVATTQATTIAIAQKYQRKKQRKAEFEAKQIAKLEKKKQDEEDLKRKKYLAHIIETLDELLESKKDN